MGSSDKGITGFM